jgi:hypothetical protein
MPDASTQINGLGYDTVPPLLKLQRPRCAAPKILVSWGFLQAIGCEIRQSQGSQKSLDKQPVEEICGG